jgi:hypothetical protein
MVFSLTQPSSSLSSHLRRPQLKVLIALSSEMSFTVFFTMVHRWMYEHTNSSDLWVHVHNCLMDAGRL